MRIMAFDVGSKRIGIAVSDETQTIATPLGYVENNESLIEKILNYINEYNPEKIVVGNPVNMNGSINQKNTFVLEFIEKLKKIQKEENIVLWDERLSSIQAEKILIKGDVSRKERKKLMDKVAAAIVLQNYLDYLKFKNKKV